MKKLILISFMLFIVWSGFSFGHQDNWDTDKTNWSNLMLAVYENNIQKVKQLIAQGADINYATDNGLTAIAVSIYKQNPDILQYLIKNGADLKTIYGSQTLLMIAAQHENTDIIKILLKEGLDINATNKGGYTPLRAAAINGSVEVLKLLIANGADINYQGVIYGYTALMSAAWEGNLEKVKVLLEAGANKRLKNKGRWTAFDLNERAMEYADGAAEIKDRKIIRKLLK